MHNATLDLQLGMRKMKRAYRDYYILKMDIRKYFNSIDKKILYKKNNYLQVAYNPIVVPVNPPAVVVER